MPSVPLILVATGTSNYYARGIMAGVHEYARLFGPWELLHVGPYSRTRNQNAFDRPHDGVIGILPDMPRPHAPTVSVSAYDSPDLPRVYVNDEEVGELASDHFLSKGWDHISYVGPLQSPRWTTLAERVRRRGATPLKPLEWAGYGDVPWPRRHSRLCRWLQQMPHPTAVLAYTDNIGAEVLEAAYAMNRRVPDDLAVLGVNDDRLVCEFVAPPLSSVALPVHRVGYEAAALLDRLLRGEEVSTEPRLISPIGLVPRRSTDHLAIEDERVRAAMRFIANNLDGSLTLADIARAVAMSPRSLQRSFQQRLGRSPREEVRRARVEAAKRLLIETEMPLADIAAATGYLYATHLSKQFKTDIGCSPIMYRRRFRNSSAL